MNVMMLYLFSNIYMIASLSIKKKKPKTIV